MKHEYTFEELAELRKIYDESGEAGLDITEMRALRKAGLLTQGLPAKPSKRELILAHCRKRIDQGLPFDGKETAPEKECENPRAAITDALVYIYDAISALQKTAFQANDKVVYGFATKLLNGELMDLKANYSKDVAK